MLASSPRPRISELSVISIDSLEPGSLTRGVRCSTKPVQKSKETRRKTSLCLSSRCKFRCSPSSTWVNVVPSFTSTFAGVRSTLAV